MTAPHDTPVHVAVPVPLHQLFTYLPPEGAPPPVAGCRVMVPFGRRTLTGVVVPDDQRPPGGAGLPPPVTLKRIIRVVDREPLFDGEWFSMAQWVSRMYLASLGETVHAMLPGARQPRELPGAAGDEPAPPEEELKLSGEQIAAIHAIMAPVAPREEAWYYLYGITGSGKTEVFLQAAMRTLAAGRSVMYLVPEIALTHQLFEQIRRRFGTTAAMLHSGMTASQRLGEWQRIRRREARLVVGARSAVFAPMVDLGLVVVDEEHESSYKSGSTPRYHARQVALHRAVQAGAACVMGSATPSLEAWHLMETGRLKRLDLTTRLSGGAPPAVRVIDVRRSDRLISRELQEELRETHEMGAQSILFLNRRGFAGVFQCHSCGYQFDCPRCSVPLTWHKGRNRMVCHYCGHQENPVTVCPSCSSLDVGYRSFGTERVEEEIRSIMPTLRIARLDTDSTAKRGVLAEVLGSFARQEVDLLLGTQMVAKGLNFPGVRTVGIVMADVGLSLPDFRAAERTFSLIVQVAGRAGRFRRDGRVLVQTLRPDHPAIDRAVRSRQEAFYREELAIRRQLSFPPFTRLLRILVRSHSISAAESTADRIAALARSTAGSLARDSQDGTAVVVLGPAPAALAKLQRNWRFQVLLRGERAAALVAVARRVLERANPQRAVYIEVDVDPVNLL